MYYLGLTQSLDLNMDATGTAASVKIVAMYRNNTNDVPQASQIVSNGASYVAAVPAPVAPNSGFVVYNVQIYNSDSVAHTPTVYLNNNGTRYEQAQATLQPGQTLQYTSENGWQIFKATSLTDGKILIGNSSNQASEQSVSGDATLNNAGLLTIANGAVSLAKMADLANGKIIGRNTSGTGVPEALTTLPTAAMPALTGDVTNTAGNLATTIANSAVTNAKIADGTIDYAKLAAACTLSLQRKNMLIDGNFDVWQRGTSFAGTLANNTYAIDRWKLMTELTAGSSISRESSSITSSPNVGKYSCKLGTYTTANKKFGIWQTIEGINIYPARNQTVTLSFWAKSTINITDVRAAIVQFVGQEDNVSGDPINSWNGGSSTIPSYKAVSGITPTNLNIPAALNPYSDGSSGANWVKYTIQTSGTVDPAATNLCVFIYSNSFATTASSDALYIAGVQLEIGTSATNFEYRPIGEELALCQRYCQVIDQADEASIAAIMNCMMYTVSMGTSIGYGVLNFPQKMRKAPVLNPAIPTPANWTWQSGGSTAVALSTFIIAGSRPELAYMNFTAVATLIVGDAGFIYPTPSTAPKIVFDAEL